MESVRIREIQRKGYRISFIESIDQLSSLLDQYSHYSSKYRRLLSVFDEQQQTSFASKLVEAHLRYILSIEPQIEDSLYWQLRHYFTDEVTREIVDPIHDRLVDSVGVVYINNPDFDLDRIYRLNEYDFVFVVDRFEQV